MKKFQQKRPIGKIGGFQSLSSSAKPPNGVPVNTTADSKAESEPAKITATATTTTKIQFQLQKQKAPLNLNSKQKRINKQFGDVEVEKKLERVAISEIQGNKTIRTDGVDETAKLVIPVDKNESWIDSKIKKRANKKEKTSKENKKLEPEIFDQVSITGDSTQYGLNVLKNKDYGFKPIKNITTSDKKQQTPKNVNLGYNVKQVASLEQQAISELLEEGQKRVLVLKPEESRETFADREKRQLYKDLDSLPDQMAEEDYEKVPVSEFGAALLRGMGWNDDLDSNKNRIKSDKIRPSLLGLGAAPPPPELKLDKKGGFKGTASKLR